MDERGGSTVNRSLHNGETHASGPGRNRKRILDASECHEEEGQARRPNIFSENLKGIGVPNKKGVSSFNSMESERKHNDVDHELADDLDGSLSGLGVHQTSETYNMSEAILALPNVSKFKQDLSPSSPEQITANTGVPSLVAVGESNSTDNILKFLENGPLFELQFPSPASQEFVQHSLTIGSLGGNSSSPVIGTPNHLTQEEFNALEESLGGEVIRDSITKSLEESLVDSKTDIMNGSPELIKCDRSSEENRFQYVLKAATSTASKINEDSLSYLNQGQSYEIKVRKLGDYNNSLSCIYHTRIRVCFHERRLQYMEKEQMNNWQLTRPGERILEVDVPLSYGVTDVVQDMKQLNVCEFDWDPNREVTIFIKVNCISSEFTPKKHGGEKGVPFRIQVETFADSECTDRLQVCACQVKVFKMKGAERKHKQDREKILKKPTAERDKYQKQESFTKLNQLPSECVYIPSQDEDDSILVSPTHKDNSSSSSSSHKEFAPVVFNLSPEVECKEPKREPQDAAETEYLQGRPLPETASAFQTQAWLVANRFASHTAIFTNFMATDMFRLSRAELIEICGLADGIRLYNSLRSKKVIPRLTIYVCAKRTELFNAIYLDCLSLDELTHKLSQLAAIPQHKINDVYIQGPANINVLVTDQVIQNLKDESVLCLDSIADATGDQFHLVLKPVDANTGNAQLHKKM